MNEVINIPVGGDPSGAKRQKIVVTHDHDRPGELTGQKISDVEPEEFFGQNAVRAAMKDLVAEPDRLPESELKPEEQLNPEELKRAEELFRPIEPGVKDERHGDDYDFSILLGEREGSVEEAAVNPDVGKPARRASESGVRESHQWIARARSCDEAFRQIVKDFLSEHDLSEADLPQQLRENPELRLRVGVHFLNKVKQLSARTGTPYRVAVNRQKSTNHPGYPKSMTSQEYAVLLALSKIDGTFDSSRVTDKVEVKDGEVIRGQHRAAAEMLLSRNID